MEYVRKRCSSIVTEMETGASFHRTRKDQLCGFRIDRKRRTSNDSRIRPRLYGEGEFTKLICGFRASGFNGPRLLPGFLSLQRYFFESPVPFRLCSILRRRHAWAGEVSTICEPNG
jgi:hypothetical protein